MSFDRTNQILTLIANLGVVAGLIFLGIEIQQNAESTEAQVQIEMASNQLWIIDKLASEEYREIYVKGQRQEWESGSYEQGRYSTLLGGMLIVFENEWSQYDRGLYTEESFVPQTNRWRDVMRAPGARAYWEVSRENYTEGFANFMDSIIQETGN